MQIYLIFFLDGHYFLDIQYTYLQVTKPAFDFPPQGPNMMDNKERKQIKSKQVLQFFSTWTCMANVVFLSFLSCYEGKFEIVSI